MVPLQGKVKWRQFRGSWFGRWWRRTAAFSWRSSGTALPVCSLAKRATISTTSTPTNTPVLIELYHYLLRKLFCGELNLFFLLVWAGWCHIWQRFRLSLTVCVPSQIRAYTQLWLKLLCELAWIVIFCPMVTSHESFSLMMRSSHGIPFFRRTFGGQYVDELYYSRPIFIFLHLKGKKSFEWWD